MCNVYIGNADLTTVDNIAFILVNKSYHILTHNGTAIVKILLHNSTRVIGEDARLYWFKKKLYITYNYIDMFHPIYKTRHVRYTQIDLKNSFTSTSISTLHNSISSSSGNISSGDGSSKGILHSMHMNSMITGI